MTLGPEDRFYQLARVRSGLLCLFDEPRRRLTDVLLMCLADYRLLRACYERLLCTLDMCSTTVVARAASYERT